ncbi:hypothetical protein [Bartonella massiliensis]|uniref:hypothetical protein n=1 Tax=Bartonella massiliensis TaxID=929795 RepID=UPI00115A8027|nr:hypothetical protein [Bartonella massiliensis]
MKNVSLKQARAYVTGGHSVLREGCDPIQRYVKNESVNLHYLKDIALDTFESSKAELKNEGQDGNWFSPLKLHILSKLAYLLVSEIYPNRDTQYAYLYFTYKS